MNDNKEILPINDIRNQIFSIRGQQVMIDRDLADLYQVPTKRLNEQVKRNIDRFPEEFRFQLNNYEKNELVANCDRFMTIDEYLVYFIGASLKDLGKKWFAFSKMSIDALDILKNLNEKRMLNSSDDREVIG